MCALFQKAVAQKFNEYFVNIASKLKQNNNNSSANFDMFLRNSSEGTIYLTPTNQMEVSNIINQLKVKATSDTNIAAIKRVNLLPGFSDVIAELVNSSLASGVFPSSLKTAKVVPIHKGGIKLDIQNYRPISLLSAFSKIFEKIMHNRVSNFLDKNNALKSYRELVYTVSRLFELEHRQKLKTNSKKVNFCTFD